MIRLIGSACMGRRGSSEGYKRNVDDIRTNTRISHSCLLTDMLASRLAGRLSIDDNSLCGITYIDGQYAPLYAAYRVQYAISIPS